MISLIIGISCVLVVCCLVIACLLFAFVPEWMKKREKEIEGQAMQLQPKKPVSGRKNNNIGNNNNNNNNNNNLSVLTGMRAQTGTNIGVELGQWHSTYSNNNGKHGNVDNIGLEVEMGHEMEGKIYNNNNNNNKIEIDKTLGESTNIINQMRMVSEELGNDELYGSESANTKSPGDELNANANQTAKIEIDGQTVEIDYKDLMAIAKLKQNDANVQNETARNDPFTGEKR